MKIDILQKVEGEVYLRYRFKHKVIEHADIEFVHYRGIEEILKGRALFDALAINPRVCGICGHSHLIATARAIEDIVDFEISKKAFLIREITLSCELIQNHIKWFYLVILPLLRRMGFKKYDFFQALSCANTINKIIAVFGGQYPHTSYAVAGGVVCDPTAMDIVRAEHFLNEARRFYHSFVLPPIENFRDFVDKRGVLREVFLFLKRKRLQNIGRGHDRFLYLEKSKKFIGVREVRADSKYIREIPNDRGYAKNVKYKDKFYEVGPIARTMDKKFIKDLHRRYKDSVFTRIAARVYEIGLLFEKIEKNLKNIDLQEESYRKFERKISGEGEGIVEAPRGSLIHRIKAKDGKIKEYEIITPTQFNLSNGSIEDPSSVQKAIKGLRDKNLADLVFRSFDICSVCTTH